MSSARAAANACARFLRRCQSAYRAAGRGDLLDLRALEQAVENLQRLSTVQANIALRPGLEPEESDIVIYRHQACVWQCGVWFDNVGSHHAGRYRRGLQLALENPAALSVAC